jgi:DNA processing protein
VVPDDDLTAAAAALASLPEMGPRRLAAAVLRWGFVDAWTEVRGGRAHLDPHVVASMGPAPHKLAASWAAAAAHVEPSRVLDAHRTADIEILTHGSERFPPALATDVEPPMVLFVRGDVARLDGPRAGIVGTRRATSGGRQTAAELGRDLARAGVRVVSGLALGIDGAAHHGALRAGDDAAPVIGVVGTGLDVVYPRQHRDLWHAIAERGVLLSEVPLGGQPTRWRFPARNRLIAALSDVLVVVESHARGGALLTVDEAQSRDVPVLAVPGSVRVASCAGTNELLSAGAAPVLGADDVLAVLDLSACDRLAPDDPEPAAAQSGEPRLDRTDRALLDRIGWEPINLDQLAVRAGIDLGELAWRLTRLEEAGRVVRNGGAIEQVSPR